MQNKKKKCWKNIEKLWKNIENGKYAKCCGIKT